MSIGHRGVQTAVVSGIFAGLGTLFCALRLWTRTITIRAVGYEDWLLLLSWIFAVTTVIFVGLEIQSGLGEHIHTLSASRAGDVNTYVYITIMAYCASIGLTKIAILRQYQRVFPTRKIRIWCWAVMAVVLAVTIVTVCMAILACSPGQKMWSSKHGTCISAISSWYTNASFNIATDLVIIILPIPVIKNLSLARKQKWILMSVFLVGGIVCILSIVRIFLYIGMATSTDPSYDNAPIAAFSVVEVNVALVCACLPTLKPLFLPWVKRPSSSSRCHNRSNGEMGSRTWQRSGAATDVGYSMVLDSYSTKRGSERLDGERELNKMIRVETMVDVKFHEKDNAPKIEGTASSTENLCEGVAHIV